MELHRIPHLDNFDYVHSVVGRGRVRRAHTKRLRLACRVDHLGDDVFRLSLLGGPWKARAAIHPLNAGFEGPRNQDLRLDAAGALSLRPRASSRTSSLVGAPGASLGVSARAWILRLVSVPDDRYFGMGEKWGPLEKRGLRSQFWNTDVWASYDPACIEAADVDPTYASIPYLIIERSGTWFGILLDSPYPAFMATAPGTSLFDDGGPFSSEKGDASRPAHPELYLGAAGGSPNVYFLVDRTLRSLTRKLQRLVGVTPRPPLWALGHHQSRWGYATADHLSDLDRRFRQHRIPNDGLWLDIDYMDGYRVFTCRPGALPECELARLREAGRHIVAILDPGVKVDAGYDVYDEGLAGEHFCLAPSGRPYTGIVWPGRTHFPDFSQRRTRDWWADRVARFARRGFDGFWVDMNEPSTGPVEARSMLFSSGRVEHEAFRNQYGLAMAQATRAGLQKARPSLRPFVVTRAASTGVGAVAAMWTGDNMSSFTHLARALPTSLNLALSGVAFQGPDVPGFGGDATSDLAVRFYQATFLFPFLRNHSVQGSRHQEPWALGRDALRVIRRMIVLRYRFLPYLYQLFVDHERTGEPVLGTVFMDGPSSKESLREDELMIGPHLLHAPVVGPRQERTVFLPRGLWYCLRTGQWLEGARTIEARVGRSETALYVRNGAVLPLANRSSIARAQRGEAGLVSLRDVDLHLFLHAASGREPVSGSLDYTVDDGATVAYRRGEERRVRFDVCLRDGRIEIASTTLREPAGRGGSLGVSVRPVVHGFDGSSTPALVFDGGTLPLTAGRERFLDQGVAVYRARGRVSAG